MKSLPFFVSVTLSVLVLSGCAATADGAQSSSTEEVPATSQPTELPAEPPAPVFGDSFGGNGNNWLLPAACPAAATVADFFGASSLTVPDAEASGQLSNNGCHYGNTDEAIGFVMFADTTVYTADRFSPENNLASDAPSLGQGALIVYGVATHWCSVMAPMDMASGFSSIVATGISQGASQDDLCSLTADALKTFAIQQ